MTIAVSFYGEWQGFSIVRHTELVCIRLGFVSLDILRKSLHDYVHEAQMDIFRALEATE